MKLAEILRESGYDYIDGLFRNHKPLQLWLKKDLKDLDFYVDDVRSQLISEIELIEIDIPALHIDFSQAMEYKFSLGLSALERLLSKLGLEILDLNSSITNGKSIAISFEDSICKGYELNNLERYLDNADVKDASNKLFIKNLNKNDILLISSVLYAKELKIEIKTESEISLDQKTKIGIIVESKLNVEIDNSTNIILTSKVDVLLPIAVKAYRLDFDHLNFSKMRLVTQKRNFF